MRTEVAPLQTRVRELESQRASLKQQVADLRNQSRRDHMQEMVLEAELAIEELREVHASAKAIEDRLAKEQAAGSVRLFELTTEIANADRQAAEDLASGRPVSVKDRTAEVESIKASNSRIAQALAIAKPRTTEAKRELDEALKRLNGLKEQLTADNIGQVLDAALARLKADYSDREVAAAVADLFVSGKLAKPYSLTADSEYWGLQAARLTRELNQLKAAA